MLNITFFKQVSVKLNLCEKPRMFPDIWEKKKKASVCKR